MAKQWRTMMDFENQHKIKKMKKKANFFSNIKINQKKLSAKTSQAAIPLDVTNKARKRAAQDRAADAPRKKGRIIIDGEVMGSSPNTPIDLTVSEPRVDLKIQKPRPNSGRRENLGRRFEGHTFSPGSVRGEPAKRCQRETMSEE